MDDEELVQKIEWYPIKIQTRGTLTASEISGLVDAIHSQQKWVKMDVPALGNEPPAADLTEIAISVILEGTLEFGIRYAVQLLKGWAGPEGKGIRQAAVRLFDRGRASRSPDAQRKFIPFQLEIGNVHFLIPEPIDENDLGQALTEVTKYLEHMQASGFDPKGGGYPSRIWWDSARGRWVGRS